MKIFTTSKKSQGVVGIYRSYVLVNPLKCTKYVKLVVILISTNFVSLTTTFITNIVTKDKEGVTFIKLFSNCNFSIDLVFYSFVIAIISGPNKIEDFITFVAQYILFLSKEKAVSKCNWPYNSNKELFYNVLNISLKIVTSMAFFGLYQGALFVHYIPGDTYDIYLLLIFYSF